MKVISRIKPRHSPVRNVTVNGTKYAFHRAEDGEFACEVENANDVQTFAASRHFAVAGKPALSNPAHEHRSSPDDVTRSEEADRDGENATEISQTSSLVDEEAQELLQGTAAEIGRNLASVSSLDVIRHAIEIEQSEDGKQRKGVDTMLHQALEAAEQAGVTLS